MPLIYTLLSNIVLRDPPSKNNYKAFIINNSFKSFPPVYTVSICNEEPVLLKINNNLRVY